MDGAPIVLERDVAFAAQAARDALRGVLSRLAARAARGELSLAAGGVAVAVALESEAAPHDGRFALAIRARSREAAFPTFAGAVTAVPAGAAATRLRLEGTYRVPFGPVGALANAAGLHRVAEESLGGFLELLAAETVSAVRRDADRAYREARGADW